MKKNLNLCRPSSRARLAIIRWLCVTLATLLPVPPAAFAAPRAGVGAAALAALIEVNTTGDADDSSPGDGVCDGDAGASGAQCTLRAAIRESNALAGAYLRRPTLSGSEIRRAA